MGLLGLILGNWQRIAAIALLLFLVSAWAMFQHQGAELARARQALARESALRAAAESQARLNASANNESDHTQRVNAASQAAVLDAQRNLANAADSHSLYVYWVAGVRSVRDDTGAAVA